MAGLATLAVLGTLAGCTPETVEPDENPFDITFTFDGEGFPGDSGDGNLKQGSFSSSSAMPLRHTAVDVTKTYSGTLTYVNTSDVPIKCETDYAAWVSAEGKKTTDNVTYFEPIAETPVTGLFVEVDVEPATSVGRKYDITLPELSDEAQAREGKKLGSVDVYFTCTVK